MLKPQCSVVDCPKDVVKGCFAIDQFEADYDTCLDHHGASGFKSLSTGQILIIGEETENQEPQNMDVDDLLASYQKMHDDDKVDHRKALLALIFVARNLNQQLKEIIEG